MLVEPTLDTNSMNFLKLVAFVTLPVWFLPAVLLGFVLMASHALTGFPSDKYI